MSENTANPAAENATADEKPETKKRAKGTTGDDVIIIKKYANRRLYNTQTSSYVTLDFLSDLVKAGHQFVVYDAKSGEDITRTVLTQIIFEHETKGQNLLPVQFLRQLISFYGNSMQSYVPSYLEMSMDAFSKNQDAFRQQLDPTLTATPGYRMFEDTVRKNMALYGQAMKMFSASVPGMAGFSAPRPPAPDYPREAPPAGSPAGTPEDGTQMDADALRREIAALSAKLEAMEKG